VQDKDGESNASLRGLSDGELMDLAVPSGSPNRRVLVMWLFLNEKPPMSLEEWDVFLATVAEKELERRSVSGQTITATN
jgi:hypothetical protein